MSMNLCEYIHVHKSALIFGWARMQLQQKEHFYHIPTPSHFSQPQVYLEKPPPGDESGKIAISPNATSALRCATRKRSRGREEKEEKRKRWSADEHSGHWKTGLTCGRTCRWVVVPLFVCWLESYHFLLSLSLVYCVPFTADRRYLLTLTLKAVQEYLESQRLQV